MANATFQDFNGVQYTVNLAAGPYAVADVNGQVVLFGNAGTNGGTVTSVAVTTANGVSGVVANSTSTPAITLTLGAITPTSVAASGAITAASIAATTTVLASAAPATATSAGTTGTITYDANFIYQCISTNVWKRVAIATW